jgi:RimJ/RimL family protein N-acetyltransferase
VRLPYDFAAPLRTERLLLRTMTEADVDDIHAYQSREDVARYLMYGPRSREEVAEKVARHSQSRVLRDDGDYWQLALERDGRVIGDLYFTIASVANATGEIGWVLNPVHAGRGYMTEAATAVLQIAFNGLGLHRVKAELDPRNETSVALCKRLGMREEAYFVEDLWFKGAWGDTAIYAILAREWAANHPIRASRGSARRT